MSEPSPNTFRKCERMVSRKLTDTLFRGGRSRSVAAYPVRAVYMVAERGEESAAVQVLVSVSKRHFKRAVKRNRVKRQIREAYRLNKHALTALVEQQAKGKTLALAFVWQADRLYDSRRVSESVKTLLEKVANDLPQCP